MKRDSILLVMNKMQERERGNAITTNKIFTPSKLAKNEKVTRIGVKKNISNSCMLLIRG